VPEQNQHLQLN